MTLGSERLEKGGGLFGLGIGEENCPVGGFEVKEGGGIGTGILGRCETKGEVVYSAAMGRIFGFEQDGDELSFFEPVFGIRELAAVHGAFAGLVGDIEDGFRIVIGRSDGIRAEKVCGVNLLSGILGVGNKSRAGENESADGEGAVEDGIIEKFFRMNIELAGRFAGKGGRRPFEHDMNAFAFRPVAVVAGGDGSAGWESDEFERFVDGAGLGEGDGQRFVIMPALFRNDKELQFRARIESDRLCVEADLSILTVGEEPPPHEEVGVVLRGLLV